MPNLTEAANHANTILAGTDFWAKEEFLHKTPISPPHGQTSTARFKAPDVKFDIKAGQTKADFPFVKAKLDAPVDKIGFLKFRPVDNNTEGQLGALTFDVKFATELKSAASRAGYVPCWFLPWKSAHMVTFRINRHNDTGAAMTNPGTGIDPLPNPDLFFTAAINGCSVFAYGDDANPTLYHCGINGKLDEILEDDQFAALGGDSAKIWQTLIEGVKYNDDGQLVLKSAASHKSGTLKRDQMNFAQVNRYDYVSRQKSGGGVEMVTDESMKFEQFLSAHRKDTLTNVMVNPWGCVFGLRTSSGSWRFTLQRNALVRYRRVFFRKRLFKKSERIVRGAPPAPGSTNQSEIDFVTSINLGYTLFFPGEQSVHYRACETISVY
jgi:hypothetical protein